MEIKNICLIRDEKGFSLLELVVVISILSFLTAAALPVWNSFTSNCNLKAAVRQVTTDIRETQGKAMAELKYYGIEFIEGGYTYSIYSDFVKKDHTLFTTTSHVKSASLSNLADISFNNITFNNSYGVDRVVFKKDGSISGVNGSIYITNGKSVQQLTVVSSGKVTIK